jgi:hypothetical protein
MSIVTKASTKVPAGWQVIDNPSYSSPLDAEAYPFVERCLAEFKKLFGLYTKSDSQVLVMDKVPADEALTRARTILHERGYRNILNWVNSSGTGRTASLELFEKTSQVA